MARYIVRPKAWDDEGYYEPPLITSIEVCEAEPQGTGLLDADGNTIWRMNDPIGFRIDD